MRRALVVPAYTLDEPFGVGMYSLQIPTATAVFDADEFTFSIEDNAEPQFRLKNTGRGAQFVKYGERNVSLTVARDFKDRTEYDMFKASTARSVTMTASKGANDSVSFLLPRGIMDSYEISGLSGQADLIRANVSYQGAFNDGTSKAAEITIVTNEDVTL